MKHPILSGSGYKYYALIWLVVIMAHAGVLYFYYDFSLFFALSDSLVHNIIYSAITPGFWFIVIYSNFNKDEVSLVATHLGAVCITLFLWLWLSKSILQLVAGQEEQFLLFLDQTMIWRIIVGLLFYSISVLIFYLIRYYQDVQKKVSRELELQTLLKDSELRMLKSQINPHFIFNSLNSVSALTVADSERAREMVIKLSDFLRYSLGKGSSEQNTLDQEIRNTTLYLDIEKVRFGEKLNFTKEVPADCMQVMVPNLILQPLFENAIKYGVYDSIDPVTIHLKVWSEETLIYIHLTNDFDPTAVSVKGEGIGLDNVRRRLFLVYGQPDLLEVKKYKSQFEVTIKIPKFRK